MLLRLVLPLIIPHDPNKFLYMTPYYYNPLLYSLVTWSASSPTLSKSPSHTADIVRSQNNITISETVI